MLVFSIRLLAHSLSRNVKLMNHSGMWSNKCEMAKFFIGQIFVPCQLAVLVKISGLCEVLLEKRLLVLASSVGIV